MSFDQIDKKVFTYIIVKKCLDWTFITKKIENLKSLPFIPKYKDSAWIKQQFAYERNYIFF